MRDDSAHPLPFPSNWLIRGRNILYIQRIACNACAAGVPQTPPPPPHFFWGGCVYGLVIRGAYNNHFHGGLCLSGSLI